MKKQILFGSALLLSIGVFSQSVNKTAANRHLFEGGKLVETKYFENKFIKQNTDRKTDQTFGKAIGPKYDEQSNSSNTNLSAQASSPIINTTWYRLSGSGNIFGMLVSASKPLNYQRILGCVSFVQRKSATYVVSPPGDGNVGTIVTYWGKNDASTNNLSSWDSTCIWAHPTNQGRYPVGGLWNSMPGNQNIDPNKAYAVGMGPITNNNNWVGSWYASKSLSVTPKNAPGAIAGEEQFIPNVSPFNSAQSPQMTKHDFPRYGFNITDQAVWVAGQKQNDINSTTNSVYGLRGAAIVKGSFNSGIMVWSMDSIIPPVDVKTDGTKLVSEPYMKFTPDGQLGYVMFLGVRQGAPVGSSNRGWQPIVYKTTNSGATWNIVNGIDFNANTPVINQLKNTMRSVGGVTPQVEAPWFWGEGTDITIDANGKLHILSTAIGHTSAHVDTLIDFVTRFTIPSAGNEDYHWPHVNTARPLIIDYYGDGTGSWTPIVIDSLDTEGPSSTSGQPGFNFNPWASATADESVQSDSRLQITRSYDGEFIAYSWAESDTNITTSAVKWNEFPNVKVRAFRTCDGSISPDVFSITSQTSSLGAVKDKAYFHYMSGEMKAGASTVNSATFAIPFTISSNPQTVSTESVSNYFAMSHLGFAFPSAACGATLTTGIATVKNEVTESTIYPNPTENNFNVRISLSDAKDISVVVYNALGQKVSESKMNGNLGENIMNVNMNNASKGVYFVKIKAGKTETTKKLVVE